jgi:transcription elongation GreA/GreB family factor
MSHPSKTELRDKMMALEAEELRAAREHYKAFLMDSRLAENEPHERDEMAAARAAADLAHGFDDPINDHEAKIDALEALDTGPSTEVGPGAVVTLNGRNFIVAVSTRRFDCGGVSYMGISQESPIYKKMAGLEAGERFDQNGIQIVIDAVR